MAENRQLFLLCAKDNQSAILNLEQGDTVTHWGRLIFQVEMWTRSGGFFVERDFSWKGPETLRGASGTSTCAIRTGMSCRLRDH
jgi:hypothetical protein